MHKCSIENERLTNILIKFYNLIMEQNYYLNWSKKILNIIIEKGKGPTLRKLRTIQLIEVDLQLLMRIFLGLRDKG